MYRAFSQLRRPKFKVNFLVISQVLKTCQMTDTLIFQFPDMETCPWFEQHTEDLPWGFSPA